VIQFEWHITDLTPRTIDDTPDVATQIFFTLTGTDPVSGRSQSLQGSYTPPLDNLGDGFVDYADLTPEIVTGWLDAMPFADDYKAQVAGALDEPVEVTPALPWASGE